MDIHLVNGFKAVRKSDLPKLLTDFHCHVLSHDKIRNLGPTDETIYPWNVEAYQQDICYPSSWNRERYDKEKSAH